MEKSSCDDANCVCVNLFVSTTIIVESEQALLATNHSILP